MAWEVAGMKHARCAVLCAMFDITVLYALAK